MKGQSPPPPCWAAPTPPTAGLVTYAPTQHDTRTPRVHQPTRTPTPANLLASSQSNVTMMTSLNLFIPKPPTGPRQSPPAGPPGNDVPDILCVAPTPPPYRSTGHTFASSLRRPRHAHRYRLPGHTCRPPAPARSDPPSPRYRLTGHTFIPPARPRARRTYRLTGHTPPPVPAVARYRLPGHTSLPAGPARATSPLPINRTYLAARRSRRRRPSTTINRTYLAFRACF
jgi:hypothetical protein